MPDNFRKEFIIDLINDQQYTEILIQKKDRDYVIKSKSGENNKMSHEEAIKTLIKNDFENIDLKVINGKTISVTRQKVDKI